MQWPCGTPKASELCCPHLVLVAPSAQECDCCKNFIPHEDLLAPGSLGRYSCFSTPPVGGPGRGGQSSVASWRSERAALSSFLMPQNSLLETGGEQKILWVHPYLKFYHTTTMHWSSGKLSQKPHKVVGGPGGKEQPKSWEKKVMMMVFTLRCYCHLRVLTLSPTS